MKTHDAFSKMKSMKTCFTFSFSNVFRWTCFHWQKNVVMDVIDKKFVKIKYFFPEFFLVHHHMRGIFLSTGEFAKTLTHTVIAGSQRLRHANTQCFEVLARAVWHRAWAMLLSVDRVNLHMENQQLTKLEKRDRKSVISIIKAS